MRERGVTCALGQTRKNLSEMYVEVSMAVTECKQEAAAVYPAVPR